MRSLRGSCSRCFNATDCRWPPGSRFCITALQRPCGPAFDYLTWAVNVFFKDMAQIVSICPQFGMWLTPIMYQETMFADKAPWFVTILKTESVLLCSSRIPDSMLTGNWFWERPKLGIYFWVVTLVIGLVGLRVFKRLRPHFSDVL